MAQRLKTDWLLFSTIVAMVGFGLVMVYSASSVVAELNPRIKSSFHFVSHQLVWAIFSFIVLMYFKKRDYRRLHSPAWAFGSVGVVLMLQILVFIADSKTHRWFRLEGIGTLQPSEFAKPALLIFLAYFVTQRQETLNTRRTIAAVCLPLAVLAATVGIGDLGTAIVMVVPAAIDFMSLDCSANWSPPHWSPGSSARSRLWLTSLIAWRASLDFSIPSTSWYRFSIRMASSRNTSANPSPLATPDIRRGNPGSRSGAADWSASGQCKASRNFTICRRRTPISFTP